MRAVLQRANGASCSVDAEVTGEFQGPGLVVLLGVSVSDTPQQAATMARKIAQMRVFDGHDQARGSEMSASDLNLPILVISQFTLYGDTRKGRRPSWTQAAPGPEAQVLVDCVIDHLRQAGLRIETGRFGADMAVSFTNDGPFTLIIET